MEKKHEEYDALPEWQKKIAWCVYITISTVLPICVGVAVGNKFSKMLKKKCPVIPYKLDKKFTLGDLGKLGETIMEKSYLTPDTPVEGWSVLTPYSK